MVAVLDAWTSGSGDGSVRRNHFAPGETLQMNALFITERDLPSSVRIRFSVSYLVNACLTVDGFHFDVVMRPGTSLSGDATVGPASQRAYVRLPIPEIDHVTVHGPDRFGLAMAAAGGGDLNLDLILYHGFYSFRATAEILAGPDSVFWFDVSKPWIYRIQSAPVEVQAVDDKLIE